MVSGRPEKLLQIARELASNIDDFQTVLGPGKGNRATNEFMTRLGEQASELFGTEVREQKICGNNSLTVDFYFDREATIVEVALGLSNPGSEFEKDVLKAIMAQANRIKVDRLFFISRPGAEKRCRQPGRKAVADWLERSHGIRIEVHELEGEPRRRRKRRIPQTKSDKTTIP